MYQEFFGQMKKMLLQLDKWLEAGAAFAQANAFAPDGSQASSCASRRISSRSVVRS